MKIVDSLDQEPTLLSLHNLESLLQDIVSGRGIVSSDGKVFRATDVDTRKALEWYRRKGPGHWIGNTSEGEIEALIQSLRETAVPAHPSGIHQSKGSARVFRINRMVAHHFAGIHTYSSDKTSSSMFEFGLDPNLTLVEGKNGSGKTSILNAVVWCLTGKVLRSQGLPSEGLALSEVHAELEKSVHAKVPVVCPLPSGTNLETVSKFGYAGDTWVSLVLEDEAGSRSVVKRTVSRTARGTYSQKEEGFDAIGLDPVSREVGTVMIGTVPALRLDEATDIGRAIEAITGIKPVMDLVSHSQRVIRYCQTRSLARVASESERIENDFVQALSELRSHLAAYPLISLSSTFPHSAAQEEAESLLDQVKQELEMHRAQLLEKAREILGDTFDPEDPDTQEQLIADIGKASLVLDMSHLSKLKSFERMSRLGKLPQDELDQISHDIDDLLVVAQELDTLERTPGRAARLKLYARIGTWISEHNHHALDIGTCQICRRPLDGAMDDVTGGSIEQHIHQAIESKKGHEQSLKAWERLAASNLTARLPAALREDETRELPDVPSDLLHSALTEELFELDPFSRCLGGLKASITDLYHSAGAVLGEYTPPEIPEIPVAIQDGTLRRIILGVKKALQFASWRKANLEAVKQLFRDVVQRQTRGSEAHPPIAEWSLAMRLDALQTMVRNTEPINEALRKVGRLISLREQWQKNALKRAEIERLVVALEPLRELDPFVKHQTTELLSALREDMIRIKGELYLPAVTSAPRLRDCEVRQKGVLTFSVSSDGAVTGADRVSNSSDLRATLLAFVLAFRNYLVRNRGGLASLLLDDPQELADYYNRQRIAGALCNIASEGTQVVITTNDSSFSRMVQHCAAEIPSNTFTVTHREVHSRNGLRKCIELGRFRDEIDQKRVAFDDPANTDDDTVARNYACELRIYLEQQLGDLFEDYPKFLPKGPTLGDFVNALKERANRGVEPFNTDAFRSLLRQSAFTPGSATWKVLQRAHHGAGTPLVYTDVQRFRSELREAQRLVESAHEAYERWRQRRPPESKWAEPDHVPQAMRPPAVTRVPICGSLAAFSGVVPINDGDTLNNRILDTKWFSDKAVFCLNCDHFGHAAARYDRVIVSLDDREIETNRLVVCLRGQSSPLARRLIRAKNDPGRVILVAEGADYRVGERALSLSTSEVMLLKVVGVIFNREPGRPRRHGGEAWLDETPHSLDRVEVALEVSGDSAVPVALNKQKVLCGPIVSREELGRMKGRVVALRTDSDESYLKRVGDRYPGLGDVCIFESVSGYDGTTLMALAPPGQGTMRLPFVVEAREVLGVLYSRGNGSLIGAEQ